MVLMDWKRFLAVVLLWYLLSLMSGRQVCAQLSVDEGPQDAAVFPGDNVTFVCDLRNVAGYSIFWFHQERNKDITINRQVNGNLLPDLQSRLSVTGDVDQEEFTLRIENVQVADGGEYYCQYAVSQTSTPTNAGQAQLVFLIPPDPESPQCEVIPVVAMEPVKVDDEVHLYCCQVGGNPPPCLTFYKGSDLLAGPGRTITHRYDITAEDNGVIFTCSMTTPALDEPRNCSLMPLRILPNATILPAVSRVDELGSHKSFECQGDGVPSIANYRWTVTNNDTGEILAPERYTVTQSGSSLEIAVMENLTLLCTVSVPSGLSGNSTARVEVLKLNVTTDNLPDSTGSAVQTSTTNSPATSSNTVLILVVAVAAVVALVLLVIIVLCLCRRKRHRKPNLPTDGGYKTNAQHGSDLDEVTSPGPTSQTNGAGTAEQTDAGSEIDTSHLTDNPLYGLTEFQPLDQPVNHSRNPSSRVEPDKRAKRPGGTQPDAVKNTARPATPPQDIPLYALPDKKVRGLNESEYSAVPEEDPTEEADSGLLYADLDLDTPDTAMDNTKPHKGSEQTVYAAIRT